MQILRHLNLTLREIATAERDSKARAARPSNASIRCNQSSARIRSKLRLVSTFAGFSYFSTLAGDSIIK